MPNIPNTIIEVLEDSIFRITPNDGYVLHNNARDWIDGNPETGEETFYRGYSTSASTVPLTYDFDNTTEIDGYTAYGSNEIFAIPRDKVDDKQVF